MKKLTLLALLLCLSVVGYGQQLEYSFGLNTGWFWFGGESATNTSALILGSGRSDINYTNNPYGKNPALSYGLASQLQKVSSKNVIFGLQAGYETLRSKVELKHAYTLISSATAPTVVGTTVFRHTFIYAHLFIGKRVVLPKVNLDFSGGLDLAYCLKSYEKGEATDNSGQTFISDKERDKPGLDTRARLGLTAYYQHLGLMLSYAYGLKNYTPQTEGTNRENYARLIRVGLVYKI